VPGRALWGTRSAHFARVENLITFEQPVLR
jgi:hypothetical protein